MAVAENRAGGAFGADGATGFQHTNGLGFVESPRRAGRGFKVRRDLLRRKKSDPGRSFPWLGADVV
ncbi:MAG: hypothetical protein GXY58_14180 [Planctomycetaceae bacterium]|nr:hypothetical protein [Planctomycetaceae bacterium]